jgi:hypothetical protein
MIHICFRLFMPNTNSWNGKWSGANSYYVRCRSYRKELAEKILSHKSYYYNFGDGWGASIAVEAIDAKEKKIRNKKSNGFCLYEWMIDSIEKNQKIIIEEQKNESV